MISDRLALIRGCLLGGAIGDALGAPTEFMYLDEIEAEFGPAGLTDFEQAYGRVGAVTDDTQMTLFTAEGLIEASIDDSDPCMRVWDAYLRWNSTQRRGFSAADSSSDGLAGISEMWESRAPGTTCLGSLAGGVPGSRDDPINTSKGCGGVMRVAPVGLTSDSADQAYELGCQIAALTHGHPGGWVSAGALAVMIHHALAGAELADAILAGRDAARSDPKGHEVADWIDAGISLAASGPIDGRSIDGFGAGWTGDEALAIAVACASGITDPNESMLTAVNHSGDTDSTGSITGQLLGSIHGVAAFRSEWIERVELRSIIDDICLRLFELHGDQIRRGT